MSEALSPNETAAAIKKAVRMNMKEVAKGGKRKPLSFGGHPALVKVLSLNRFAKQLVGN